MSPLPISRSQLDRLGERLAAVEEISDEDYDLLLDVLSAYQSALAEMQQRLVDLGYEPTTRTKTTSVLIDKLRRTPGMKLKGVQDVAGARIVSDCDRFTQDEIVKAIVACFADGTKEPRVKDRRAEPSAGYRAVHVTVHVQDLPVEIQVRTRRQDMWAQITESLGDKWGRGIRYGDPPTEPDTPVWKGGDVTRADLWAAVLTLADRINTVEEWEQAVIRIERALDKWARHVSDDHADEVAAEREDYARIKESYESAETSLRSDLAWFASITEGVP